MTRRCSSSTSRPRGSTRRRGVAPGTSSTASGVSGTTILLTTHYLDEAQHLADRVVVIDHGRVIAEGTPEQLATRSGTATVVSFRLPEGASESDLPRVGEGVRVAGTIVEVRTQHATADVHALTGWAVERGLALDGLTLARPSLEDVYLDLVGEQAEASDGTGPTP